MGGGTHTAAGPVDDAHGLSPRGRGNPDVGKGQTVGMRSIPAWAGEPGSAKHPSPQFRVYPRVGGGTVAEWLDRTTTQGLSPRGRGNLHEAMQAVEQRGSIPAWAGEPVGFIYDHQCAAVYPRVGGGTGRL